MFLTEKETKRFNEKWIREGDCHLWQGPLDRDGYGTFFLRRGLQRAHRVGYFMCHGPIPEGMVVNHTCRNRNCVNPQHLQVLTKKENSLKDSSSIGYVNSQKTHCKNGHLFDKKHGNQRYCSICTKEKHKRLREKWKAEGSIFKV